MATVEILLSTFNGGVYLEEQLKSFEKQTFQDWRLIVRDDGSDDNSIEVIESFAAKYPDRVVFVNIPKKLHGVLGAYAQLMDYSCCDYIFFADQDDVWNVDKLEIMLGYIRNAEKVHGRDKPILVYSDLCVTNESLAEKSGSFFKIQHLDPLRYLPNNILIQNIVPGCSMAMNKAMIDLCIPVPEEAILHDWWVMLTASVFAEIVYIPEQLMLYRRHISNVTSVGNRYGIVNIVKKIFKYKRDFVLVLKQAETFRNLNYKKMDANIEKIFSNFVAVKSANWLQKRRLLYSNNIHKYGLLRNIAFYTII